eukprot:365307-Chlamydomonas_euryale.AAC.3
MGRRFKRGNGENGLREAMGRTGKDRQWGERVKRGNRENGLVVFLGLPTAGALLGIPATVTATATAAVHSGCLVATATAVVTVIVACVSKAHPAATD